MSEQFGPNVETVARHSLLSLWSKERPDSPRPSDKTLLAWAAGIPDSRLRRIRGIGAKTIRWIRVNQPSPEPLSPPASPCRQCSHQFRHHAVTVDGFRCRGCKCKRSHWR